MKMIINKIMIIGTLLVSMSVFAFGEDYTDTEIVLNDVISIVWTIPIELSIEDSDENLDGNGILEVYAPESVIKSLTPTKREVSGAYRVELMENIKILKVNKRSWAKLKVAKGQLLQVALEGIGSIKIDATFAKNGADIVLSGIGKLEVSSLNNLKEASISNKGTGEIIINNIDNVSKVSLLNKGIGAITIKKSDNVNDLKLIQHGIGKVVGAKAANMRIDFSAAGKLYVEATKSLIVEKLDGIGSIFYRGGVIPQVKDTNGVSKVKPW